MIRILATAIALTAFTGAASAQVTASLAPEHPVLRAEAVVTGDVVRIGDLVDHAGIVANVPIFRAPDLGSTGTVSADAVVAAVRPHALIGLDTGGVGEVVVTRLSRRISPQEIEACIAQALARQYRLGSAENISLSFDREPRTINLEPGIKGNLQAGGVNYDLRSGRFDAAVELPAGRGHLRLTGQATVTATTVALAHAIGRGEIIREDDIVAQRRPRTEIGGTTVTDIKNVVGLAARTDLQANRPLRTTDLMKPEIVQRNQSVTLVYEVPGIILTVRGKATEGGAEGDSIMVLNEQTKRSVQGIIAGPGRVIVGGVNSQVASIKAPSDP